MERLEFKGFPLDLLRKQLLKALKLIRMKLSVIPPLKICGQGAFYKYPDCVRESTRIAALITKKTLKKAKDRQKELFVALRPCFA
ncbi:MAG: hypothetical protein O2922_01800 [Cyanobacteria bacterium]|jgi:hypothetical protein|nr:hypothetical protein [Cyanobacteriota bacterium]